MAALPYMQLYVADYLADTMHLKTVHHGAYLLLIFNYWQTGKALNDDNEELASIAKLTLEEWLEVRGKLERFFVVKDESLIHPRIEADLDYVESKQRKAALAGKASAVVRANKNTAKNKARGTNVPTDVATDVHTDVTTGVITNVPTSVSTRVSTKTQLGGNHKDPDPDPEDRSNVAPPSATFLQAEKIARYLAKRILSVNERAKLKPDNWVQDIERAIRIDERTEAELVDLINWIYAGGKGSFWIANIMSGKKLREQFDQIAIQKIADVKIEKKKSLALPMLDDELERWALKNGLPRGNAGELYPEYRRRLNNLLEKRGD